MLRDTLRHPLFWTLFVIAAIAAVTLASQELAPLYHEWADSFGR